METNKKMLIVNQSAPYSTSDAQEALDLALAAAAFDQDVSLLFAGDACYQLMDKQSPALIDKKDLTKMLRALPIYGIEHIYVDKKSLDARQVSEFAEGISVKPLDEDEVKSLYRNSDTVIRF